LCNPGREPMASQLDLVLELARAFGFEGKQVDTE
jgi:hypothetical protein